MDSSTFKIASYNSKNVKRALGDIRRLSDECVLIALQETWLLPEELSYLNTSSIDGRFSCTGTSAVDTMAGFLRGRPYGGTALLWKTRVFSSVTVIKCDNPRVCAISINTAASPLEVVCDISNGYVKEPFFCFRGF